MFMRRFSRRGVSLVEMLVVVAIIGVAAFLVRVVVNLLHGFFQGSAVAIAQREAQATLFEISKDIRNCQNILVASGGTLQLRVFDTQMGYNPNVNPNLFDPVKYGTMTYQYDRTPTESYLLWTLEYPSRPTVQKKLLRNVLLEPNQSNYLFNACNEFDFAMGVRCPPNSVAPGTQIVAVDVRLTASPFYVKDSSTTYVARVMRRSKWQ